MIPKRIDQTLHAIAKGVKDGNLCVFECKDKNGEPVYIVSVSFQEEDGIQTFPLARIFTYEDGDDPFVLYDAPDGALHMRPDGTGGRTPVH